MSRKLRVYLAGPDVFLPHAIAIGQEKKRLCAKYGFEGLYPFDNEITPGAFDGPIDIQIYQANVAMIRSCDFGILNLTPFRGASADVGTVFELGMLTGLNKPVFGYSNVLAGMLERLKLQGQAKWDDGIGQWVDCNGMSIENFRNTDNLMIDCAVEASGSSIIKHDAKPGEEFVDLKGFEKCLLLASSVLQDGVHSVRVAART